MAEILNTEYTDANIKTLEGVEHIRRRPGMYIGRLGNGSNPGDGIYVLLKEIVDNCIDEFSAGFGKQVQITIADRQVTVRDFGRGIPLNSVIKATSELNTGGKFDDKVFKKSVGLNGVGSKAVNALSQSYYVESFRNGESSWARYERGELKDSGRKEKVSEKNGTLVVFTPDSEMFGNFDFNMDYVETRTIPISRRGSPSSSTGPPTNPRTDCSTLSRTISPRSLSMSRSTLKARTSRSSSPTAMPMARTSLPSSTDRTQGTGAPISQLSGRPLRRP